VLIVFALWWIFFSIIADRESQGGFLNANLIELTYIPTLASLGLSAHRLKVLPGTLKILSPGTETR
jgi:hypothetical protein